VDHVIGSLKARAAAGLFAALSLGMVVGVASPASAGNAANAKLCQKGNWLVLAPDSQSDHFQSQDECVQFGAKGATPVPFNPNWGASGT
jgi:hypothetical protein